MDHPSDWFNSRDLRGGIGRLRFQRDNGAGLGFGLGFSGFRPGSSSVPPGTFQPGPTGKRGQHPSHRQPAADGGKQESNHLGSGCNADQSPSTTPATSA